MSNLEKIKINQERMGLEQSVTEGRARGFGKQQPTKNTTNITDSGTSHHKIVVSDNHDSKDSSKDLGLEFIGRRGCGGIRARSR